MTQLVKHLTLNFRVGGWSTVSGSVRSKESAGDSPFLYPSLQLSLCFSHINKKNSFRFIFMYTLFGKPIKDIFHQNQIQNNYCLSLAIAELESRFSDMD